VGTERTAPTRPGPLAGALGRAWRGVAWWVRGVTGEARYDAYVAHERAAHPDREPMTPREFWRGVYREQDAHPGTRCC